MSSIGGGIDASRKQTEDNTELILTQLKQLKITEANNSGVFQRWLEQAASYKGSTLGDDDDDDDERMLDTFSNWDAPVEAPANELLAFHNFDNDGEESIHSMISLTAPGN